MPAMSQVFPGGPLATLPSWVQMVPPTMDMQHGIAQKMGLHKVKDQHKAILTTKEAAKIQLHTLPASVVLLQQH